MSYRDITHLLCNYINSKMTLGKTNNINIYRLTTMKKDSLRLMAQILPINGIQHGVRPNRMWRF